MHPLCRTSQRSATTLLVTLGLVVVGSVGCEKHPAGEAAEGYGHGSAHPASKAGDMHSFDGSNTRFSDSQGTDIRAPHKEQGESEDHASGGAHGRPGPGGQQESEQPGKH